MYAQARSELQTLRDMLRFAVSRFNEAGLHFGHGTDNAFDEASYLILHTLHLPVDRLDPFLDARLTASEISRILDLVERRIVERIPLPYLTREAWLGDFRFYVDERAIVPRSFVAELLHDRLAPWLADDHHVATALDLCTGSGCIAILVASYFPDARIDAADLSAPALEVARKNVEAYGLEDRIELLQSAVFSALSGRRYDLVLANPPYVTTEAMDALPPEYRKEPALALAGGADGLDIVRRIVEEAPSHLNERGLLVVEIGHNHAAVEAAFPGMPFIWPATSGGDDRVFLIARADLTHR